MLTESGWRVIVTKYRSSSKWARFSLLKFWHCQQTSLSINNKQSITVRISHPFGIVRLLKKSRLGFYSVQAYLWTYLLHHVQPKQTSIPFERTPFMYHSHRFNVSISMIIAKALYEYAKLIENISVKITTLENRASAFLIHFYLNARHQSLLNINILHRSVFIFSLREWLRQKEFFT